MLKQGKQTCCIGTLRLDSGVELPEVEIAYHSYGERNAIGSNSILVLHALTGSSAAAEWWSGLIGTGKTFDPATDHIICPNLLGSCYGSTGPESIEPPTGRAYKQTFPELTVRDIARANIALLDKLSIRSIALGIGGSMGGMVLLEMAALRPELFQALVPIAVGAQHSAWRLAFSSSIRKIMTAFDPSLANEARLREGLRLARQVAMTSYRCAQEFDDRFGRDLHTDGTFEVERYLEHQGDKIVERFSPYSYLTLTRAMELYDLSRDRGSVEEVAQSIVSETLCVGISSDLLYPVDEIWSFAKLLPNAHFRTLYADHGHDSFLVDVEELAAIVGPFLHTIRTSGKVKSTAGRRPAGSIPKHHNAPAPQFFEIA